MITIRGMVLPCKVLIYRVLVGLLLFGAFLKAYYSYQTCIAFRHLVSKNDVANLISEHEISVCSRQVQPWTKAKFTAINAVPNNASTCSKLSSQRGPNQKIISFSFYEELSSKSKKKNYFQGIARNAFLLRELYPGWLMRVYHNVRNDTEKGALLRMLACTFRDTLDLCYAGDVPGFGNLLESHRMALRFLPMADPLVDIFLSRDLDSDLTPRERSAVAEWETASRKPLHLMRDHPHHGAPILGGMWGARLEDHRQIFLDTFHRMLVKWETEGVKGRDQTVLKEDLWTLAVNSGGLFLQHDSYFCNDKRFHSGGDFLPFPTRREAIVNNFVGASIGGARTLSKPCPENCRKKFNWTMC